MHRRKLPISLLVLAAILLFACHPQREASFLLQQAQALVETHPDSALQFIDSIIAPERTLSKRDYMSFLVTQVQARYKNYLPVENDTLIFNAKRYFAARNNDPRQTALAYFYSGVVHLEKGDTDSAMEKYMQAADFAAKTEDGALMGFVQFNIGELLEGNGLYLKALGRYKKAEYYYTNYTDNLSIQARCFAAIGQMYALLGNKDDAFAAFYKGLELAKNSEDNQVLSLLLQNLFVSHTNANEYEKAVDYLRQSFDLNNYPAKLPRYYLNFAKLFSKTHQSDSLTVYVDKLTTTLEQSDDLYFKVAAYSFLATIAKENNNIDTLYSYSQKELALVNEISQRRLEQSVYEVQQRYDYQKYQFEHAQALLKRQRISIFLLMSFLIVSLVAITMYRRTLHQKNKLLSFQHVIHTLKMENEQALSQLTTQSIEKNSTQQLAQQLRKAQSWKFDRLLTAIVVKAPLGDKKRISIAQFNTVLFGQEIPDQWDVLAEIIEEMYPNILSFIKETYPELADTRYKVAVLSFVNIQPKEISLVLNVSNSTVHQYRSEIRHLLGLKEKRADLAAAMQAAYHSAKS